MSQQLTLATPLATDELGRKLAGAALRFPASLCIYLQGDLGAGKTSLARGFLRGCGHSGRVPSPTYTLIEPYDCGGRVIHHLDLYRLQSGAEAEFLGIDELAQQGSILLIEWPERGGSRLLAPDLEVFLQIPTEGGRQCKLVARSSAGEQVLAALAAITA